MVMILFLVLISSWTISGSGNFRISAWLMRLIVLYICKTKMRGICWSWNKMWEMLILLLFLLKIDNKKEMIYVFCFMMFLFRTLLRHRGSDRSGYQVVSKANSRKIFSGYGSFEDRDLSCQIINLLFWLIGSQISINWWIWIMYVILDLFSWTILLFIVVRSK